MSHEAVPWVERYRPSAISDICGQESLRLCLKQIVNTHEMPHLLFHGPPGTGKTTAAYALCRELFGEKWRSRVKEMNASDDRGIGAVRDIVKKFAEGIPARIDGAPGYKVMILDECDMMTRDAQMCLRRIMEDHMKHTRFIIVCNYVKRIVSALISRCCNFRFEPIPREAQLSRLRLVATGEGVVLDEVAAELLVNAASGDMRQAINQLQSACSMGATVGKREIELCLGLPPREVAIGFIESCTSGEQDGALDFVCKMSDAGWVVDEVLKDAARLLANGVGPAISLSEPQRAEGLMQLARAQSRLVDGCDEVISLSNVALELVACWQ